MPEFVRHDAVAFGVEVDKDTGLFSWRRLDEKSSGAILKLNFCVFDEVAVSRSFYAIKRHEIHLVSEKALHRGEVAAFVMHGRESVACELLRDVRHPIALALVPVGVTELRALASGIQHAHRAIGHTSGEFPCTILVERPAGGRQRVLGDLGQLERLAVVERGVSAAVAHHDRMLG